MNKKKLNKKNSLYLPDKKDFFISLYGFLAVIFVLIPEWIAEFSLIIGTDQFKSVLPRSKNLENINPHLFIYSMNLKELRQTALKLRIHCYSNENKQSLSKRVIRVLKKQSRIKSTI